MTTFELTLEQLLIGGFLGVYRKAMADKTGKRDRWTTNRGRWEAHCLGGFGETAVAVWYEPEQLLPWFIKQLHASVMGNFRSDVGPYQVRACDWNGRNPYLKINPYDKEDDIFILVLVNDLPRVTLAGWICGRDARQTKYWDREMPNGGCWCIPVEDLHPMDQLVELQAAE